MCNVLFTHLHFSVFDITGSGEDIFTMLFVFCEKIRNDMENPLEDIFSLTIYKYNDTKMIFSSPFS